MLLYSRWRAGRRIELLRTIAQTNCFPLRKSVNVDICISKCLVAKLIRPQRTATPLRPPPLGGDDSNGISAAIMFGSFAKVHANGVEHYQRL